MVFKSFRSLVWVFVLVAAIVYICAVVVGSAIGVLMRSNEAESIEALDIPDLAKMYGSLPGIMLTLVLSAFGGIDWADSLGPMYDLDWIYGACFLAYMGFMLLGLINIITGVFIDNA